MIVKGFAAGETVSAYPFSKASTWVAERRVPPGGLFASAVADATGTVNLPTLAPRVEYLLWGSVGGRYVQVMDSTTRPPKGTPV